MGPEVPGVPANGEELSREGAQRMLKRYALALDDLGYEAVPYPDTATPLKGTIYRGAKFDALCHARWMCGETQRFLSEGRFAKAYRWIGMIQGLLFMGGVYSIVDLKEHNRA
jgi:hypothetical protein